MQLRPGWSGCSQAGVRGSDPLYHNETRAPAEQVMEKAYAFPHRIVSTAPEREKVPHPDLALAMACRAHRYS